MGSPLPQSVSPDSTNSRQHRGMLANAINAILKLLAKLAYETGEWTPTLQFGGASAGVTYLTQNGTYVKIGRLVVARFYISLTAKGTSTGAASLAGLPFSSASSGGHYAGQGVLNGTGWSFTGQPVGYFPPGSNLLVLDIQNNGAQSVLADTNATNSSELYGTLRYFTD